MTKLRISIVQYLNTAPLVWGFTHGPLAGKYELSFTVPSQCAEALRSGEADIAIIPAIEYQRIDGLVILPNLAIASKNQVRSLLLVAKKPIAQVRSVALDSSSRSTQALTRILCVDRWGIAPEFFEAAPDLEAMLQDADAALLIGDPALRLSITLEAAARRETDGVSGLPPRRCRYRRRWPRRFQRAAYLRYGRGVATQHGTAGGVGGVGGAQWRVERTSVARFCSLARFWIGARRGNQRGGGV